MVSAKPPASSSDDDQTQKSVKQLQELAEQAVEFQTDQRPDVTVSRAARLHLIDELSRVSGAGLAVIAAVCAFVAVLYGGDDPFRAAVWFGMVLAAIFFCRQLRRAFRRGEEISAQPFRWRANYSSSLAVLSASVGAGAIILAPPEGSAISAFEVIAALAAAVIAGGVFHAAHLKSLLATTLPGLCFLALSSLREFGDAQIFLVGWALLLTAATIATATYSIRRFRAAVAKYPVTRMEDILRETPARRPAKTPAMPADEKAEASIAG